MDILRVVILTVCFGIVTEGRHLELLRMRQNGGFVISRQVNKPPQRVQMNTQNIVQQRNIMRPTNQGTGNGNNIGQQRMMNSGNNQQMTNINIVNQQGLPNNVNNQQNNHQVQQTLMGNNGINRNFMNIGNAQNRNINGRNTQVQNMNNGNAQNRNFNNVNMMNLNTNGGNGMNMMQNGHMNANIQQRNNNNQMMRGQIQGQGQNNMGNNKNQGNINIQSNMALASGPRRVMGNLRNNIPNNMNLRQNNNMMQNVNNNFKNNMMNSNMMNNNKNQNNGNMAFKNNKNNLNLMNNNNMINNQNFMKNQNKQNFMANNLIRNQLNNNLNNQRNNNNGLGGIQNLINNAMKGRQQNNNAGNNGNANKSGTGNSKQIKITIKRTRQETASNQEPKSIGQNKQTGNNNNQGRLGGQRFGQNSDGRGMWKNIPAMNGPISQILSQNIGLSKGRPFLPVGPLSESIKNSAPSIIRPGSETLLNAIKNPNPITDVLKGILKGPASPSTTGQSTGGNRGLPNKAVPPGKKIAYQLKLKSKDGHTKSITVLTNATNSNNSHPAFGASAINDPQITFLNNTSANRKKKKMSVTLMSSHTGGRPIVIEALGKIVLSQMKLPDGRTQFVINADPPAPLPFNEEMEIEADEMITTTSLPTTASVRKSIGTVVTAI